jgi:hypothetical protein
MKTYGMRECRCIPTILDVGTRLRWSASRFGRFIPDEGARNKRLDGPQSRCERYGAEKISCPYRESIPAVQIIDRRYTVYLNNWQGKPDCA